MDKMNNDLKRNKLGEKCISIEQLKEIGKVKTIVNRGMYLVTIEIPIIKTRIGEMYEINNFL